MRYQKVLSLDGGGIRGLIAARILQKIEDQTGKRIHELFDLIVGTSTGGIIAAGLTVPPNPTGSVPHPHSAKKMVELYANRGKEIFNRSLWRGLSSIGGLADERYSAKPLETILKELFGEAELKDTRKDIVVTSYDIEARKPYLFKSSRARTEENTRNHLLRHVGRATSAAPTYFEPFLLDNTQWKNEGDNRRVLVDGGVFANNPSMIALSEALSSGAGMKDIVLCSIGTGRNDRKIHHEEAKDWGLVGWAKPVLSVMMDGMSDSADYHVRQLLPDGSNNSDPQRYFRFDIQLENALDDLDAAHRANINALRREADRIMRKQRSELATLINLL